MFDSYAPWDLCPCYFSEDPGLACYECPWNFECGKEYPDA